MCFTHRYTFFFLFICLLFVSPGYAQKKRKPFIPGQPAVVFDERLSALREQPDVKAPIQQRLSRGRAVGVVGITKSKSGSHFLRVAVSRNVRGWMLAAAILRLGNVTDGEKLLAEIAESRDDITKVRLARLCADSMRSSEKIAPRALLALGQAAENAANKLSRDALRLQGKDAPDASVSKRDFLLSFDDLDRFNRAGVTYDYDEGQNRLVYDGAAYRELLRRYPRSVEAASAGERLAALGKAR